jgi:hypothetical protein
MKVLARFGLITAMLNAYDEVSKVDATTNADYRVAVEVKNILYLALLFTPAFVALGGVALTELIWYFISDSIENSNIELYLYDSLLFNKDDHNASRFFNHIDAPKAFSTNILLETLHNSGEFLEIKGFGTTKEIQTFIAKTQESHPALITSAMKNELSHLKATLYGFSLKKEDSYSTTPMSAAGITINVNSSNSIKLSQTLYNAVDEIYLCYTHLNKEDKQEMLYKKLPKAQTYDIAEYLAQTSDVFETIASHIGLASKTTREKQIWMQSPSQQTIVNAMLKDISIIFKSKNINLKYSILYNTFFKSANNYAEIKEITAVALTDDDYNAIKENNNV